MVLLKYLKNLDIDTDNRYLDTIIEAI